MESRCSGRVHRRSFEPLARRYAEETATPPEPHLLAAKALVEMELVAV
jgi:hypothetical protein